MKQNIAFQALKPFIPPENRELYAESLTEDVAKACDSQEGESNPPGEGQEEGQEVMPMSHCRLSRDHHRTSHNPDLCIHLPHWLQRNV